MKIRYKLKQANKNMVACNNYFFLDFFGAGCFSISNMQSSKDSAAASVLFGIL
jgi:hypothetical protein